MKSNSHSIIRNALRAISGWATLTAGKIWIGDGSGIAQEQTFSGDATVSATGLVTLANRYRVKTINSDSTDAAISYTAAQVLAGILRRDFSSGDVADLFPTPALLVAAVANPKIGDFFTFDIINDSTTAWVVLFGFLQPTGVTVVGTPYVQCAQTANCLVVLTNVSEGTETYTVFNLATAGQDITEGAGISCGGTTTGVVLRPVTITNTDTGSGAVGTHEGAFTHSDIALNTTARHGSVTIGADGEHSLATQVLSGVDAAAAQKGHLQLAGELGGTAASPTVAATHSGSAHHAAVTVSAPISLSGQALSLVNNAGAPATVTAIDVGALATASDVVVPTSKAVATYASAAVAASHARSHALDGTSDHSVGDLVGALPVFTDATPTKLITKSVADTRTALGLGIADSPTLTALTLSNGQLVFPATQVPSANANTLDDYEEGTWTAAFEVLTSGSITIHNSYKTGSYTKIGRLVNITGYFEVASVSSPVGNVRISGLPFTCATGYQFVATSAIDGDTFNNTLVTQLMSQVNQATAFMYIYKFAAGVISVTGADFKAGTYVIIDCTYVAA